MAKIDYSVLKGKIDRFKPAPSGNPHLWMIVDVGSTPYFATINVQSSKDVPGSPVAQTYLDFLVDDDYSHPIVGHLRGLDPGLQEVQRNYDAGALDYIKGNLFDPRKLRVLPSETVGGDDLVHRLEAAFGLAQQQNEDIVIVGSQFRTSPGQTDAVFGETPTYGIDNTHMAQGDPAAIDKKLHENGPWHDGAIFLIGATRVTAIFLAFQTQAWQTDAEGQPVDGTTGYEAPRYALDGSTLGAPIPATPPVAELTSLNRLADGTAQLVVTNMAGDAVDLTGWTVTSPSKSFTLAAQSIAAGQPLSVTLDSGLVVDSGGILSLLNAQGLRVDGVAYLGGPASGWSTSFAL